MKNVATNKHHGKDFSKYAWWNPPRESVLVQFLEETSLDGLKYVGQKDRHMIERIAWLLAFTIGVVLAGILIADVWDKYGKNPIIVAFSPDELSISRLPFPAITICNANRVLKRIVLEIQKNSSSADSRARSKAQDELKVINSICASSHSLSQMMNYFSNSSQHRGANDHIERTPVGTDVIDLLEKVSQPCGEMIHHCFAGTIEVPCELEFHSILTESGKCCTGNMLPSSLLLNYPGMFEPHREIRTNRSLEFLKNATNLWSKWEFKNGFVSEQSSFDGSRPLRQFKPGKSFGLSLLLFPDLENYYCTSGDSLGFKVVAHSPLEFPHPLEFGLAVPPNMEVHATISPELTLADDDILNVDVSSRRCYFPDEYQLKYFKAYTDSNCIDECSSNYTVEDCGCVWYFQPHDNVTRLCGESDRNCTRKLAENTARGILHCSLCYPLCNELDFRLESSQSPLQNYSKLWPTDGSASDKMQKSSWFGKPVTILNIFYGQRTTVPKVRKKLFESTDLIASTGGLLGLCLGFSGLSAVEIVYFCTLRTWFQKKHLKRTVKKIGERFISAVKKLMRINNFKHHVTIVEKNNVPLFEVNPEMTSHWKTNQTISSIYSTQPSMEMFGRLNMKSI